MPRAIDTTKRPVNLSLTARTLERARELGMNVSQTVDALLAKEVERVYWEGWNERNKDAIDAYNERVRQYGVWGSQYRTFARGMGDGRESDAQEAA